MNYSRFWKDLTPQYLISEDFRLIHGEKYKLFMLTDSLQLFDALTEGK